MKCNLCGKKWNIGPGAINYCYESVCPMTTITPTRSSLLQERAKTHGDFRSNAAISQRLKKIVRENTTIVCHPALSDVHREALDMICLKLSRILSGQADFKDHWDDIAGYAQLAAEATNSARTTHG